MDNILQCNKCGTYINEWIIENKDLWIYDTLTGGDTYTLESALKDLVVKSRDYFNPQQRATLKEVYCIDLSMEVG